MSVEILAPVGGEAQLLAAVRSGADAVYLGTQAFNARRNAQNFDAASLKDAVSFCHARNVKVHVTLNTLLKDAELPALAQEIEHVAAAGTDAVITQDLAAARLVRDICPSMELHASTQMTIHNIAGAQAVQELGFARVVLARELSLEEIRAIRAATDIDLEVFVHGALCMSMSGQCYLSSLLGGRSGNRGLCAQPCRLPFSAGDRAYALSLKDMSYIPKISALAEAGVSSFKIEGRMKRPEYVAAAVTACRKALAGEQPDMETLEAVFSRSGFTQGYLWGKRNLSMFGYRTKEDVQAAAKVLSRLPELYRNERQSVPVSMHFAMEQDKPTSLSVSDGKNTVCALGELPQQAQNRPLDEAQAQRSLQKTGGTPFVLQHFSASLQSGLTVPSATLNALRRDGLEQLLALRSQVQPHPTFAAHWPQPTPQTGSPRLRVRVQTAEQLKLLPLERFEMVYLPIAEYEKVHPCTVAELPTLVFPHGEQALLQQMQMPVCANHISTLRLAKQAEVPVHGGYGLNILNTASLQAYADMGLEDATLSFELRLREAAQIGGSLPRGLLGYGHLPLMQLRCCPAQSKQGCKNCTRSLVDRKGIAFPLLCNDRAYTTLLNPIPLYMGDKDINGVDFVTLYFTTETSSQCQEVAEAYLSGRSAPFARTTGLYERELL